VPRVTLKAVVDIPEATAPVLTAWFKGYITGLTGQIEGLEIHSIDATTEGANEQAARRGSRVRSVPTEPQGK